MLKAYRGVHEVISTIMLNAIVGAGLVSYLLNIGFRDEAEATILKTEQIPPSGLLPNLNGWVESLGFDIKAGTELHGFVLVAALLGVLFYVVVWKTRFGYDLRASGVNPWAALTSG